ncbi:MAG: alpha/beta fold hydrolase [Gemmatimonadetes bacterium]|nr:alpha/beta fold hydrolase [Gemmatimonadota bacterium]
MGGPGVGSLSPAAYPGAYPWTAERDFIVFGQRGTRHAEPALECPEVDSALATRSDARLGAAARTCRARLQAADIDLAAYHTDAITADLEDLRQVLDIDHWILFGTSYGTRIALDYARDVPEHLAAMVLDSPLPPEVRYDDESARNLRDAIIRVIDDCDAQATCRAAYPELGRRFFMAFNVAERSTRLAAMIDLTSADGITSAPGLMDAIARGAVAAPESGSGGSSGFTWGMRLSVWCSEAWPFSKRAREDRPAGVLGGYESAAVAPALCRAWDVPPRPAPFVEPVVSSVPTLLIAGEFDPLTPPTWARRAAASLANSRVIVVRGGGHSPTLEWSGDGCALEIAAAFIRNPTSVLGPDARSDFCVLTAQGPEYETGVPAR